MAPKFVKKEGRSGGPNVNYLRIPAGMRRKVRRQRSSKEICSGIQLSSLPVLPNSDESNRKEKRSILRARQISSDGPRDS